jgi:hypothetical protein
MTLFPDSRKRLDRALDHFKTCGTEWDRVVNPDASDVVAKANDDWTAGTARVVRKFSAENSMALELGESFYQMRAALDSLIYQAAVFLEYPNTPSNPENLYFPICAKPRSFKDSAVSSPPFPDEIRRWIEAIQPYQAQNPATNPAILEAIQAFKTINTCAKIDRHRHLHLVMAIPARLKCNFVVEPKTIKIRNVRAVEVNVLEDESPFLFFEIEGADIAESNNIKLKTDLALQISVDQIPVPHGSTLDSEIKNMLAAVDWAISFFESGFKV